MLDRLSNRKAGMGRVVHHACPQPRTGDALDINLDVEDDILKRLGSTPVTQMKGPERSSTL